MLRALIGEYLDELSLALQEMHRVLSSGRRLVFSVCHPEMVAAGKETYCERSGMEYRLGARRYTVVDYLELLEEAALEDVVRHEFLGNRWLVEPVPSAAGLLGFPVLVVLEARKRS